MASAASAQSVMEINVPTPWGHLATKCWNFPSDSNVGAGNPRELVSSSPVSPVVCLHGWQDNAGSFDKLIPLLDRDIPFICVDFTGHGRSSGRPAGTTGDLATSILDVKRVFDYFGIESGGLLMGHSMGGAVSVGFAATFPGIILKCLTFDAPAMFPRDAANAPNQLASAILKHLEFEASVKPRSKYTYQQAYERFMKGRDNQMTEESARILLKRGLKLVDENGDDEPLYEFSRDVRVTFPNLMSLTVDQTGAFVQKMSCHLKLILFKDNHWARAEASNEKWFEQINKGKELAFATYQKNCRSFKLIEVEGRHHTHLDHPERVNAEVNAFFKKPDSKL